MIEWHSFFHWKPKHLDDAPEFVRFICFLHSRLSDPAAVYETLTSNPYGVMLMERGGVKSVEDVKAIVESQCNPDTACK